MDIDAGDQLVENIKPFAKRTMRPEVLGDLGGFGALVEISKKYKEPVLVSGTDGVGTKLKLAFDWNRHDTVGIDLVAMSVNDILVQGAEPLFFLDYFACGKLDVPQATDVIKGIAAGCEQAGCALIGGETAEMPGMYPVGEYDLAGFAVGVVENPGHHRPRHRAGRRGAGPETNGVHSNGYSLVRKIRPRPARAGRRVRQWQNPARRHHRPHPHLCEAAAGADAATADQGHGPHHRRRHHRKHPARAAGQHRGADRRRQLGVAVVPVALYVRRAMWTCRKCTAPSTAASAWW